MSSDQALTLIIAFFRVSIMISAPILIASLIAGVLVGIIQTATQINESSVSYIVKVVAVIATVLFVGPAMSAEMMRYTRASFGAIATVVQ